jgi:hypothetical protein
MNKQVSKFMKLNLYIGQAGYSIFDSTPTTFLLASGIEDAEWTEFI